LHFVLKKLINLNYYFMPAKIRLQRRGKKGMPFYHIVIADGRAPRDGKFIENIGTYNPLTKPAEIKVNIEKAIKWLKNGAQPTDTVRAILSYKGVMFKYHLLKGVVKGVLTEEQAEVKFQAWVADKEAKISNKKKETELTAKEKHKKRIEEESKVNDAKAAAIAKKLAKEIEKEAKQAAHESEESVEEPVAEEVVESVEEPVAEVEAVEEPVAVAEVVETPAEEVKPEAEANTEETQA
jgi:small subunit ribosomal protein S16